MTHTFPTSRWRRLALLAGMAFVPVVLCAQGALPSGQELVRRHVAAIGGEAAFKAINSMRVRGRFEMSGQNISAEFEQLAARPDKLVLRAIIPGVGHTEQGFDGKVAWTIDPQAGPRVLLDRERDETIADSIFDAPLHLPDHVKQMTTLGRETFDGRPVFRVKIVLTSGVEQDEFFDVENGLMIGWQARRATPLGIVPTTATLRDWKKFGAIMQPTTLVQKALFVEQILRVTSVEYDVVPTSTFVLPLPIQALSK
jgi:hypothetical protein